MEKQPLSTASEMRRISRLRESQSTRRRQIADMFRWGLSHREMYGEGERDGKETRVRSLGDVLAVVRECGLGQANLMEEADDHGTLRVFNSLCGQIEGNPGTDRAADGGGEEGKRCFYLAGFLAGAIEATGRFRDVRVREMSCGCIDGESCMFIATWQATTE